MSKAGRGISSVVLVVGVFAATMALGYGVKHPCVSGDWADERQYNRLCYSDIVPLYFTEHLESDEGLAASHGHPAIRLPYLDECPGTGGQCDEYPLLTMYAMRLAATPASTYAGFFYANALLLIAAGVATAVALARQVGTRALLFAAAPTLLVYGLLNWDLLAVAPATVATVWFLSGGRGRNLGAGVLLGIGAAAKLYPALLVLPFAWQRLRERDRAGAVKLAGAAAGTWVALNLPFALLARESWKNFFTFNAARPADFDSLWFIGCRRLEGLAFCPHTDLINKLSLASFVIGAAVICAVYVARRPARPVWPLAFPLLIAFLLTNKVYSPQFSLWLLPWFALVFPNVWAYAAFQLADIAVFVTRFTWFGRLPPGGAAECPAVESCAGIYTAFEAALIVRAAVLVACVVLFLQRGDDDEEDDPAPQASLNHAAPT